MSRESAVNLERLDPVDKIRGESVDETSRLRLLLDEARDYVRSHTWCGGIEEEYFGFGIGGVVGVFMFDVCIGEEREWLWVITGDLPSAYIVTDNAHSPSEALRIYVTLMEDWISAVRSGKGLDDVFPVEAPADVEHAEILGSRLEMLTAEVIPESEWD